MLLVAQTAVIGKKALDVRTCVAADELVIAKGKVPACQVTRRIMANAAFLLIQAVGLDLPLERLHQCADFVIFEIAKVIGKEIDEPSPAFFPDEFSVLEEECLAGEIAGMTMTSTAFLLEQRVRVDGLCHGHWCHRRQQD
ncbi:MAG: hypothetical protein OEU92_35330 [Alphaproteobacteria bacterium]|nr:hypothetical protein [Alphaproteobacteria bacterium]